MRKLVAVAAIISALGMTIAAQTNQKLAQAQKENTAALMKYEWKSRTEVLKDGETKNDQLAQMGYDSNGELQKTMIATSPELDIQTHGLRGLIAKNKKKEFMKTLDDLRALAKSYSELSPDKMQRFMTTATITPDQNFLRIRGNDVLQNGDSMTMWVDPTSRRQRRVEINTMLKEKSVRIVSEFRDIPKNGPTYMARNETSYGTALTIITQNFDYTVKAAEAVAVR
jgi:hypothetical protein